MTRIAITGACGRMGRVIAGLVKERADCTIIAGIDKLGEQYDEFPVSFTELKPDGSYAYCRMETARIPYEDYIAMGRQQQAAARQGGTIETDRQAESPSIFASCLPWLNYTSLTHPACTPADSNVRVSWGQLFMRCGMTQLSGGWLAHRAVLPGPGGGDRRPVPHER